MKISEQKKIEMPINIPEGWKDFGMTQYGRSIRHFSGLCVLYSLDQIENDKWEHHVSISYRNNQPTDRHIKMAVRDLGLQKWSRDDQGSQLPHFWSDYDPR